MKKVIAVILALFVMATIVTAQKATAPKTEQIKLTPAYALAAKKMVATAMNRHVVLANDAEALEALASNDSEAAYTDLFIAMLQLHTTNMRIVDTLAESDPNGDAYTQELTAKSNACFVALRSSLMQHIGNKPKACQPEKETK